MHLLRKSFFFLCFMPVLCFAQAPANPMSDLIRRLQTESNVLPEKLLSTRSVVIYQGNISEKEFSAMQKQFQRIGIDAVAYYDAELFFAGKDVESGLFTYLSQRDIVNFILIEKKDLQFQLAACPFSKQENWINENEIAWSQRSHSLMELLQALYRQSWGQQQKANYLINDYAERNLPFSIFRGRRSEFFAVDLKVDKLAVTAFSTSDDSLALVDIMRTYPFNYGLVERNWSTQKLRQEGYLYELCYIYARGKSAKVLLGFEINENESGFVSMSFNDGKAQLTTYPADIPVYKFYVRHIVSGNIFLGKAWDADPDWDKALENHIQAFRAELQVR